MKPYGLRSKDDVEEFGPPTKEGKLRGNHRKTSRRGLHKQARNDGKKETKSDN